MHTTITVPTINVLYTVFILHSAITMVTMGACYILLSSCSYMHSAITMVTKGVCYILLSSCSYTHSVFTMVTKGVCYILLLSYSYAFCHHYGNQECVLHTTLIMLIYALAITMECLTLLYTVLVLYTGTNMATIYMCCILLSY